jgi:hypothetical protein
MAIGSDPEIGKQFTVWKDMNQEQRAAWFKHFHQIAGADCLGGYATLGFPKRKQDD